MIITLKKDADPQVLNSIRKLLSEKHLHGFQAGQKLAVVNQKTIDFDEEQRNAIEETISNEPSYVAVSRAFHPQDTVIKLPHSSIGGDSFTIIAGADAIKSNGQIHRTAIMVHQGDAAILTGNAFPQQMNAYEDEDKNTGESGLQYLRAAADANELDVMSEADSVDHVDMVARYADIVKIGAHNMRNYELIRAAVKTNKVIALTRAQDATIDEWLNVAEYIAELGNMRTILVDEGIRTFDHDHTKKTMSLDAVPALKKLTHYPVITAPSAGTGDHSLISAITRASFVSGANGVIIDVSDDSDDKVAITSQEFLTLSQQIKTLTSSMPLWQDEH